jgi:hypothetical protein
VKKKEDKYNKKGGGGGVRVGFQKILPPLNGERLVIPVLLGPYDIDVRVYTGFRHGSPAIRIRDLNQVGRIDLIVAVYGGGLVERVRKGGGAQDRGVRNRRTQGD